MRPSKYVYVHRLVVWCVSLTLVFIEIVLKKLYHTIGQAVVKEHDEADYLHG